MANGTLVSVDVAVVLQLTGGRNFTLSAEARNIKAANILKTLFPSTPELILTIISPIQLEYISFTWNGERGRQAVHGLRVSVGPLTWDMRACMYERRGMPPFSPTIAHVRPSVVPCVLTIPLLTLRLH